MHILALGTNFSFSYSIYLISSENEKKVMCAFSTHVAAEGPRYLPQSEELIFGQLAFQFDIIVRYLASRRYNCKGQMLRLARPVTACEFLQ